MGSYEKMMNICLANIKMRMNFHYSETHRYFKQYRAGFLGEENQTFPEVTLNLSEIDTIEFPEDDVIKASYFEFSELIQPVSEVLLSYHRCCFHATAMLWNQEAYLFIGRSGIGKSTQYKNWKELYPEEVKIINGDKPILEFRENGEIYVHSSPWTGKERWGSKRKASLAGIIYLSWGNENMIRRMEKQESVYPILQQFFARMYTEESCHRIISMAEHMINTIPIWNLNNLGDLSSSKLTHDTILAELSQKDCLKAGEQNL